MLATPPRKKKAKPKATIPSPQFETFGELQAALGNIPPDRIRMVPPPGTATKRDLLKHHERGRGLFELVDGTLVEKPMGSPESHVETELIWLIREFLTNNDIGFLYSPSALIEIMPKLVRGPDVSFVPWTKRSERTVPREPISNLIPDLVVEVLSPGNTVDEMQRKLKEYLAGGVREVWLIDPRSITATIHTSPDESTLIDESGTLDGGEVLPGFRAPLAKLFERLEKPKAKAKRKKKK